MNKYRVDIEVRGTSSERRFIEGSDARHDQYYFTIYKANEDGVLYPVFWVPREKLLSLERVL